jgi:hypothetical protein
MMPMRMSSPYMMPVLNSNMKMVNARGGTDMMYFSVFNRDQLGWSMMAYAPHHKQKQTSTR